MEKYIDGVETLPVVGYEDTYRVSSGGVVYRYRKVSDIWVAVGFQDVRGYISVRLSDTRAGESKTKTVGVHRLVAEMFIPNPEGYQQVDHIDEDKTNNCVSNLRWCTPQMNMEYYRTLDGRDYHTQLRARHLDKVRSILSKVRAEQKQVEKIEERVQKAFDNLTKSQKAFEEYKKIEMGKIELMNKNYKGYSDTAGTKYKNVEEMVKATGKAIVVDGKEFISCGSAAQYIVDNTEGKNKATISKELRRYLQGKKSAWVMYDRFTIGY